MNERTCRRIGCQEPVAGPSYRFCVADCWREYRRCPCGAIVRGSGDLCGSCSHTSVGALVQVPCRDCGRPSFVRAEPVSEPFLFEQDERGRLYLERQDGAHPPMGLCSRCRRAAAGA